MSAPRLLVILDASRAGRPLVDVACSAARGGAHLIQLREGAFSDRDLFEAARALVAALAPFRARLMVNERLDIALASGAHGVHLKDRGLAPCEVRALIADLAPTKPGFLIGRSCHDAAGLAHACGRGGADLATIAPVLPTGAKEALGIDGLSRLLVEARRLSGGPLARPWFALGGLSPEDVATIGSLGTNGEEWGIAGIRPFLGAVDDKGGDPALAAALAFRDALQRQPGGRSNIRT